MFGYEYVSLDEQQIELRRRLLDQAGWQAWRAPIPILLAVGAYRFLFGNLITTSNPKKKPTTSQLVNRRVKWTLGTTYIAEFGPLQVQLLGIAYTIHLLSLVFRNAGNDYMHVTKAFSHVAVSQLPLHYMLGIKSPISPITIITGLTHERLNAYHRLFGRIIHALFAAHAVLYLKFFIDKDLLQKRLQDNDVRLGIAAFWTMNILGILAIPPIRRYVYYKVFYRSHIILSIVLLGVLWFHVPYTHKYVIQAGIAALLNVYLRRAGSQSANVKSQVIDKNLIKVEAQMTGPSIYPYVPGVHVYLNWKKTPLKTPFTVVGIRQMDGGVTEIQLIAKNSGGPMTSSLVKVAAVADVATKVFEIEGPYGEAQKYMPNLLNEAKTTKNKFLLVAGGVGATYILPIQQALRATRGNNDNIRVIWVVKKEADMQWATNFLMQDKDSKPGERVIIVHPTQPDSGMATHEAMNEVLKKGSNRPNFDTYVDDFVNEKLKPSRADGVVYERDPTKQKQILHDVVNVLVCGPSGMTQALRKSVGKHVMAYGRDVRWYEEQFGFGGS